ncbi:YtxH domain-containing protein [Hymenobacter sp. 15J16-1T3B]|uniref:YtxH domain-containing protein n=1 Tax=Hymenobacter sp. 15J16-1T3B TaxID=2886941 RepID=UPI001D0FD0E1|nr:YtxH domain-containing protein [Hymenobacter sp. 15J16-1T3B]MCC3158720.1 YtxH domain-containing protein [Hymenobacter sp. 15J16-1T3B]
MKDNSGKVLLALLAGASAGIVAGLLMAPETGTATRENWGKSLGKFGDDLNKLLQDGLSKLDALKGGASGSGEGDNADRSGAEDALAGLGSSSGKSTGSKGGGGRKTSGNGSSSGSGPVDGPDSASTATYSQGTGSPEDAAGTGGTTGGSGVGS